MVMAMAMAMAVTVRGIDERDMYVVALLFIFLIFRPNGLFGKTITRD